MCYTGFRIAEFLELTSFSYDSISKTLRGGKKTAAGKNRIVPIHPKIQPIIENWISKKGKLFFVKMMEPPILQSISVKNIIIQH